MRERVFVVICAVVCIPTIATLVCGFQVDSLPFVRGSSNNKNNIICNNEHHKRHRTATTLSISSKRYSNSNNDIDNMKQEDIKSRRNILHQIGSTLSFLAATTTTIAVVGTNIPPVHAFANKISNKYDDRPKRRGPQPTDLGVRTRTDIVADEYMGLKSCSYAPNCFSSSIPINDDPDHSIPAWISKNNNLTSAMEDIYTVITKYYPPGQQNIDGGGFEVKTYDPTQGYLYVQFESLKNGYIDDFEAAYIPPSSKSSSSSLKENDTTIFIQIRSSSRVGYLDYGVNAKRINYIAQQLRTKYGWTAEGVTATTHQGYFQENDIKE